MTRRGSSSWGSTNPWVGHAHMMSHMKCEETKNMHFLMSWSTAWHTVGLSLSVVYLPENCEISISFMSRVQATNCCASSMGVGAATGATTSVRSSRNVGEKYFDRVISFIACFAAWHRTVYRNNLCTMDVAYCRLLRSVGLAIWIGRDSGRKVFQSGMSAFPVSPRRPHPYHGREFVYNTIRVSQFFAPVLASLGRKRHGLAEIVA